MAETPTGRFRNAVTIEDVRAAKPKSIHYGVVSCWWTHDPAHVMNAGVGRLPTDPRGGVLFETDDVEGFLSAAEANPGYYGRHGLRAFMAAHHHNCDRSRTDPRPWCFRTWEEYNRLIDEWDAEHPQSAPAAYVLNRAEVDANIETGRHIETVQRAIAVFCHALALRGRYHDASKLERPEVTYFAEYTPKLRDCTYGSEEYRGYLEAMKPALDHHYAHNRHHPEHFENGVDDMNILDLVEMLCDWKAATLRHADGDLARSVEINTERFKLSPQLASILRNSVSLFDEVKHA